MQQPPPPGGYPPGGYPPGVYPPGAPPGAAPQSSYGPQPGYGPGYGMQPGYGPPPFAPGVQVGFAAAQTHTLAIISLIAGLVVCIPGSGIAAIVCGFIAKSAIAKEPHRYHGGGMALAGIILGFLQLAGVLLYVLLVMVLGIIGAAES